MSYLHTPRLSLPLVNYRVNSFKFRQECTYSGIYWGFHLGEDVNQPAGTEVKAIGRGRVIYSSFHPGSEAKPNWGNLIIIVHKNPKSKKIFYSLYGHLKKRQVNKGDQVELGHKIGSIGNANTPENGWWPEEHLHFGIYIGPKTNSVPPGYWVKHSKRTKLSYWREPLEFIKKYKA